MLMGAIPRKKKLLEKQKRVKTNEDDRQCGSATGSLHGGGGAEAGRRLIFVRRFVRAPP